MDSRGSFLTSYQRAVSQGNATLEWAVVNGQLVKIWIRSPRPTDVAKDATAPADDDTALKAFEETLAVRHANGEITVSNGRVVSVIVTEKIDLVSRMREPRRAS